ncbi:MAG: type IV pilin [Halolamina sp.]
MKLTEFFTDEDAVSPVIGVILMVAITVILAAVIGTFVLRLGNNLQQQSPQATFEINSTQLPDSEPDNATITHSTGDSIDKTQLSVAGDVENSGASVDTLKSTISGDAVSAGDSFEVNAGADSGTIRVVWSAAEGDNSATLQTFDYE